MLFYHITVKIKTSYITSKLVEIKPFGIHEVDLSIYITCIPIKRG